MGGGRGGRVGEEGDTRKGEWEEGRGKEGLEGGSEGKVGRDQGMGGRGMCVIVQL